MANDITTAPSAETDAEFAQRFAALVAKWKEGTRHRSRMKDFTGHSAFREIVALGDRVVPLILAETERTGSFLFLALPEITGAEPPIPDEHRGNKAIAAGWMALDIEGMQAAWLAWGRENGYRWEHVVQA